MCFIPITPSQSSIAKRQVPERPDALCTVPPACEPHPWPCLKGRNTRDECTSTFCIFILMHVLGMVWNIGRKLAGALKLFHPKPCACWLSLRALIMCLGSNNGLSSLGEKIGSCIFYGQIIIQHKCCMVFAEQSLVFDLLL